MVVYFDGTWHILRYHNCLRPWQYVFFKNYVLTMYETNRLAGVRYKSFSCVVYFDCISSSSGGTQAHAMKMRDGRYDTYAMEDPDRWQPFTKGYKSLSECSAVFCHCTLSCNRMAYWLLQSESSISAVQSSAKQFSRHVCCVFFMKQDIGSCGSHVIESVCA
jgi:hypothetical protein